MTECVTCESNPECVAIRDCIPVCQACIVDPDCMNKAECAPFYIDCGMTVLSWRQY